ncbi:unnamed protein product [Macrosiphum euphorbiae]|uniref:Transposable element P transposase-like GTP-binding insertion domain-containing protein n=1 Tax=Macrosiphum euphorbiae TaxID=13131 RepID=A0AAV0XQ10_9HEMI|nr:unnamed protein product [Macrosiphum euphorbiae]
MHLGIKKTIVNGNGQKIRWDYIQKLYQKENCEGLRAATKLTNRHLHYDNEKMNVRLAAQVLSNSVCDALLYLNGSDPNFEGSLATAEFCLFFNNAFDILNSRKQLSNKPFNNSINENTFQKYSDFLKDFSFYVQGLSFEDGTKVVHSQRKTGFVGMILAIKNALEYYKILREEGNMTYLLTYKLSQDHLETFF